MTILKLSARNIKANLGRLLLTAIAIIAGVGFVSGSFILADSLSSTFNGIFESAGATTDARVQVAEPEFGFDERTLSDDIVADIEALPETGRVTPGVTLDDQFTPFIALDAEGEEVKPQGPPIITFSVSQNALDAAEAAGGENQISLAAGTIPAGIDQVALDADYAERLEVSVGDQIDFITLDGNQTFELAGIIEFPITGGAYFVMFDFESAQTLYDKEGLVDSIELSAAEGSTPDEMIAAVAEVLPEEAEVIDQQELIANDQEGFNSFISIFRNVLLAFAGIALFVSLFIIYNTFAILVNQRMTQIGMLRAIGATGSQIRRSVVMESALVGLIGSIIGIGAGVGVASLIKAGFQAAGGFPETGTVVTSTTVIISLAVGIIATVASALGPAFLASRVSPIAAIRNEGPSRRSTNRRIIAGAVILAVGLLLLGLGLFGSSSASSVLTLLGIGAVFMFVGVALLSVLFAGPVVNFLGQPTVLGATLLALGVLLPVLTFTTGGGTPDGVLSGIIFVPKMLVSVIAMAVGLSILGSGVAGRPIGLGGSGGSLEGQLAKLNAARSPQRTAATATALTIGIALISTVGTVGESLKASFTDTLDAGVQADLFIYDVETQSDFSTDVATAVRQVDGIGSVSSFRFNEVRIDSGALADADDNGVRDVASFDSDTGTSLVNFDVSEGDPTSLGETGVLVFRDEADKLDLAVGDTLLIEFPQGETEQLTVAGIFEDNSLMNSPLLIDNALYNRYYTDLDDGFVGASIAEGADPVAVKANVDAIVADYSGVEAQNNAEFREDQEGQVDGLITLVNFMLSFALFVAFLGVINTIVLSVVERTKEIGLLRAIGTTRKQLRSMIRWEAVIVCLFGALLGIAVGVVFAYAAVSAIPDDIIGTFAFPFETLVFGILVAALAGVLAALFPALSASRKNVLDAISSD